MLTSILIPNLIPNPLCAQEDETDDLSWEDASFAEREID